MNVVTPSTKPLALLALCVVLQSCGGGGMKPATLPLQSPSAFPSSLPIDAPAISPGDAWPEFGNDDQRSGYNPAQSVITKATVATLKPKWIATTPAGGFANPIVSNDTVYIADLGGGISAFNEGTGNRLWSINVHDSLIGTPVLYNGVLYIGSYGGSFFAVNAATDALQTTYPVIDKLGSFEGSPLVADGNVIVGRSNLTETSACTTGAQVVEFNPNSSAISNTLNLTPAGDSGVGVWSSPAIGPDGYLYVATGNSCTLEKTPYGGNIIKIDPRTLKIVWAKSGPPGGPAEDADYGATAVFINGMVVDGAKDGNVYAYDTATGALRWKTSAGINGGSIIGSLATDGTSIYVPFSSAPGGGALVALDPTGRVKWTVLTGAGSDGFDQDQGVLSAPVVSQGVVFAGYTEANCTATPSSPCTGVSALDAQTGQELWRANLPGNVWARTTIVNGGLFVFLMDTNASLYCFTPGGV